MARHAGGAPIRLSDRASTAGLRVTFATERRLTFEPSHVQRLAIEAPLGPVLVVAGPGAGKTYCLIARIARLIAWHGLDPRRICAVTFTNKAADEIATRLQREIGPLAEDVTRGTLHALCFGLLREHASAAGLRRGFGIADEDYQRRVLRRLRVRPERHGQLLLLFGRHRLQHIPLTPGDLELFEAYSAALRARNLLDYDDLIARAGELLRTHDHVRAEVRRRWDYVLVDEFQDLSLAQYEVVTELAARHRNCFAVGDDEQSIFSWTGADPAILGRFRDDFEIAAPIILDLNRRCSRQIFETARRLVTHNPGLFEKRLEATATRSTAWPRTCSPTKPARPAGSWPTCCTIGPPRAWTGASTASSIARTASASRLETRFIEAGVPCLMARGQALMDDELDRRHRGEPPDHPGARRPTPGRGVRGAGAAAGARAAGSAPMHRDVDLLDGAPRVRPHDARRPRRTPRLAVRLPRREPGRAEPDARHRPRLVDALLAERLGRYRNPLDERAAELTDPAELPGAAHLAERLLETRERAAKVWLEPDRGMDLVLLPMLKAVVGDRVDRLGPDDRRRRATSSSAPGASAPSWCSRPCSCCSAAGSATRSRTTSPSISRRRRWTPPRATSSSSPPSACAAGVIVDQFQRLVRPSRPISPRAAAVHGYHEADVRDQPTFAEVWPAFRAFVGDDLLVAHNGHTFDVPVLRRLGGGAPGHGRAGLLRHPAARALADGRERAARGSGAPVRRVARPLASRASTTPPRWSAWRATWASSGWCARGRPRSSQLLGWLGLALALTMRPRADRRGAGAPRSRHAGGARALQRLPRGLRRTGRGADAPSAEELIERLGGQRLLERLRSERPVSERYPASAARLAALVESSAAPTLAESIELLLGRVALSRSDGSGTDDQPREPAHAARDEGARVLAGVHRRGGGQRSCPAPSRWSTRSGRRSRRRAGCCTSGMTRAKDRLVLTAIGAARRPAHAAAICFCARRASLTTVLD